MISHRAGVVVLLAVLAAGGCQGDGRVQRAKVTGQLMYRGKPLANANVSFLPSTPGLPASIGKTDTDGRFVLGSYDPDDGAPVGPCKVAVSLRGPPKKLPKGMGEAFGDQLADSGDPLISIRYFSPDTSGLTAEVVAGKTNEFVFELKD